MSGLPLPVTPIRVSVVVPMADDGADGAQRLASARAQTWPHCEAVAVSIHAAAPGPDSVHLPGANLAQALNAGIAASQGDHVCMILPGDRYAADKVARQVAFMQRFELEQAVLYCNHARFSGAQRPAQQVLLPSVDPSDLYVRWFCGLPLAISSLMVPRAAFDPPGGLDARLQDAAPWHFFAMLSRHLPFVGMAECLVETGHAATVPAGPAWREVHGRLLAQLLANSTESGQATRRAAWLGEAAEARLAEGLPGAAWDTLRAAWRMPGPPGLRKAMLAVMVRRLLHRAWRRLPGGWRQALRGSPATPAPPGAARLDFSAIYRDNGFVGTESLSGAGSTLFQTRIVRRELPLLLRRLGARSVLDIPCGDFHWMRAVDLQGIHYTGADLVEAMVQDNRRRFGAAGRAFQRVNLLSDPLPAADLVLCRDCLVHLPFEDARAAIDNLRRSACTWLLTTTFPGTDANRELGVEGWRALNLCLPPFGFPEPEMLLTEKCTEAGGLAGDKALGLWRISALPHPSRP